MDPTTILPSPPSPPRTYPPLPPRTGDLTLLGVGAVVNPTSESFSDKNPVSDAIYHAAGPELKLTLKSEVRSELLVETTLLFKWEVYVCYCFV